MHRCLVCHCRIWLPRVERFILVRLSQLSWGSRTKPAILCLLGLSNLRSNSSLKALLYGVGDRYICATFEAKMSYRRDMDVSFWASSVGVAELCDQVTKLVALCHCCGAGDSQSGRLSMHPWAVSSGACDRGGTGGYGAKSMGLLGEQVVASVLSLRPS